MALTCSTENSFRRHAIHSYTRPHFWYKGGLWILSGLYGDGGRPEYNFRNMSSSNLSDVQEFHNKLKGI